MNKLKFGRVLLAAAIASGWTGCGIHRSAPASSLDDPAPEAVKGAGDHNPVSPKIALAGTGGLVRIDWDGLELRTLIEGVGEATGRVIVYDRRQVEWKPCVSLSRAFDVQIEELFLLCETVLAGMQLACLPETVRLTSVSSWEVIRIVPRDEGKGSIPVDLSEDLDLFASQDIPWFSVAGPSAPASNVRAALARKLKPSDRPSPVPLSPALLRARYARSDHSTGREGRFDPNLCDLTIFDSPYPRCVR